MPLWQGMEALTCLRTASLSHPLKLHSFQCWLTIYDLCPV